ncbi:MAG: hypothetical protein FVQ80_11005 [Planctomycetes bacterium]|nr:hypothetical protein [Planctomycetota bacterium]
MSQATNYEQETLDPQNPTGPKIKVVIAHALYLKIYKYNPVKYENIRLVKEVLENPERIFGGIRAHNEGGWCYAGRPSKLYISGGQVIDFPSDKVFAVYVNPRFRIFDWCLEYVDDSDNLNPKNWTERYRSLLWPKSIS